jgi:hypothetical protein
MADIDFHHAGFRALFQAGAKLVALRGRIEAVEDLAQGTANEVLRQFCAVFRPIGFHDSGFRNLDVHEKTEFLPELLDHRPELVRRTADDQPALGTGTLDARLVHLRQQILRRGRTRLPRAFAGVGRIRRGALAGRNVGHRVTLVAALLRQVGRNLERRQFAGGLVFDLLRFRENVAAASGKYTDQQKGSRS